MIQNFNYYTPTRVVFGKGTENQAGELVKSYQARKVLVHYGSQHAVKSGLIDRICKSLNEAGVEYVTLGGVVPNPRLSLVYKGIDLCKKENVDFLLAVGGGSVIDSTKAIAYGLANEGDVWELYERKKKATGCFPLGVVLTIAASGSEMSNSSVITKEDGWIKRSYNDDIARPKFAVMDPELTMSLPDYQTESGCTDIMMHTMERYFVNGGSMGLTDEIAQGLLRTVMKNALILHKDPQNYEARAEVMWAGSLSHNGLTGCGIKKGDFVCHGLEHELGAMFDVTHGAGLAAVWSSWARYVMLDCLDRFAKFAETVLDIHDESPEETAAEGIDAMEDFFHEIGMPTSLSELGVHPTEEQFNKLADDCFAHNGHKGSAKVMDRDDYYKIYKIAA
ncbi:iron-containing alcohol dehydrogenase [Catenisphaera adipataccumulans]|uniref:NADH-dependent butanol dehydrogenase A n=1 Tax=Catenisphaera adipataccumulans TaxID=700500 RepID=A0A7W8CY36_9FIRM|nr:iron-containing alcohol dehydrogenase [Catenisphaera adipataccumulans]MBB5182539.1 hypothetical protein [Catenisphaera adipataccumulans]